jgi:hypothetical protein
MKNVVALIVVLSFSAGCGGGGMNALAGGAGCTDSTYSPNYASDVFLRYWSRFPLTVAVVREGHWTQTRENAALEGFNAWVEATEGGVIFQAIEDLEVAQVIVQWFPKSHFPDNVVGRCTTTFRGRRLESALIEISITDALGRPFTFAELRRIALHEFGHALGIAGHSPEGSDVMYFKTHNGTITERDRNTLTTAYCNSYGRSVDFGAPVETVVISCPAE